MKKLFILLLTSFYVNLIAQTAGSIDPTFNVGTGLNGIVSATAIQPDGKIIIAGDFTSYNGSLVKRIARLYPDGSIDSSFNFNVGSGANNSISRIAIQNDGKILVTGQFTSYSGIAGILVRLNADGSVDPAFSASLGTSGGIQTIAFQADGKIILGRGFTYLSAPTDWGNLTRINTNGSMDSTFHINGVAAKYHVFSIAMQSDGKIIIGGAGNMNNDTTKKVVIRLNSDGSTDTSFHSIFPLFINNSGIEPVIRSMVIQNDGKIVVGGILGQPSTSSTTVLMAIRLTPNGSMDSTFNGLFSPINANITGLHLLPDGNTIAVGDFQVPNSSHSYFATFIARLNELNGKMDTTFIVNLSALYSIETAAVQTDGKVIVGGHFHLVLARLLGKCASTHSVNVAACDHYSINSHNYTSTGTYWDMFQLSSACDSIVCTHLTINPSYYIPSNKNICNGDSIIVGYHTYNSSGTYNDTLQTVNGCDSIIVTQLTVNPLPSVTYSLTADVTPHQWDAYPYINGGLSPYTYSWNWGDGTTDSVLYTSHTYTAASNYNVCLQITDANNCSSVYCQNDSLYRINNSSSIVYINVLNPTTNITTNKFDSNLTIYPNPANGFFKIVPNGLQEKLIVDLYDVTGKHIFNTNVTGTTEIDVSKLDCGIYTLTIKNRYGTINKKLLVTR